MNIEEPTGNTTHFEQLGEATVRAIIVDFYERVFADVMIGFMFEGVDRERLVQREYEFSARHLGADVVYTGRTMRAAHAKHPIRRGHFQRRNVIFEETLRAHDVPAPIREAWMRKLRALESVVLNTDGECR
jgi:hemoglobin